MPVGVGHLNVFDTRSGRLLRTLTIGRGPQAIAVDEQTNRVLVTNQVDGTVSDFDAARL